MKSLPLIPCACLAGLTCIWLVATGNSRAAPPLETPATRPADSGDEAAISSLLARLSADDARDRQTAQEELIKLGPSITAQVAHFSKSVQDIDARSRAEYILQRLADEEKIGATVVSIKASHAKPEDIFASLGKQAGVTFLPSNDEVWQADDPLLDIDLEHAHFWDAVLQICAKSGLEPATSRRINPLSEHNQSVGTIRTAPGVVSIRRYFKVRSAASTSGPFLIMASSSLLVGPREAAANHVAPQAAVWLRLVCEPKLHALAWQAVDTDPATDDKQQPMKLTQFQQDPYCVWNEIGTISYKFDTAAQPGDSIPRFKGTTRVILATDVAHLESKQLLQGVSTVWHAGDLRFDIAAVLKNDKGDWVVKTRVTVEPGTGKLQRNESLLHAAIFGVRCQLLDEHDHPLAFSGGAMTPAQGLPRSARAYDLDWSFAARQEIPDVGPVPTAPVKLVWDFPADIVTVDVPFTLQNLKLRD